MERATAACVSEPQSGDGTSELVGAMIKTWVSGMGKDAFKGSIVRRSHGPAASAGTQNDNKWSPLNHLCLSCWCEKSITGSYYLWWSCRHGVEMFNVIKEFDTNF